MDALQTDKSWRNKHWFSKEYNILYDTVKKNVNIILGKGEKEDKKESSPWKLISTEMIAKGFRRPVAFSQVRNKFKEQTDKYIKMLRDKLLQSDITPSGKHLSEEFWDKIDPTAIVVHQNSIINEKLRNLARLVQISLYEFETYGDVSTEVSTRFRRQRL